MNFERHSSQTRLSANPNLIGIFWRARNVAPRCLDLSPRNSCITRHQPIAGIESHLAAKSAPTSPVFSTRSALFPKSSHLIENKRQARIFKFIRFNQFRTLFHFSPASPLFSICSPKHTGGIPPSRLGRESSITSNIAKSPAIITFSRSTARYDTMTPANKLSGAVRATA
jgi:hypothetical protein